MSLTNPFQLHAYRIGTGMPGAPAIQVGLVIDTDTKAVEGLARFGWTVNPPVNCDCRVEGVFTWMAVMPPSKSHIMVKVTGYPAPDSGIHALSLYMVLEADWQTGTADIEFVDAKGVAHKLDQVPVSALALEPATV